MENDEMELEEIKADVYETWAVINRAFEQIIAALDKLEKRGVLEGRLRTASERYHKRLMG